MQLNWRSKTKPANDNAGAPSVEELRTTARRPIYREAFLHLPEGVRLQAVAMDISPLGARLRLARRCSLPQSIEVTILDEVKREPARVAWISDADVGLEYINPDLSADAFFEKFDWLEN